MAQYFHRSLPVHGKLKQYALLDVVGEETSIPSH